MLASAGMTTAPNLQPNVSWSHTSMFRFATYSSAQGQEMEPRNINWDAGSVLEKRPVGPSM
jgi:hypothetical protein